MIESFAGTGNPFTLGKLETGERVVDAGQNGIAHGDWIRVRSRRGQIEVKALITERSPQGLAFIPFHFAEAAANELTLDARDPRAKIPDYKVCAIALEPLD